MKKVISVLALLGMISFPASAETYRFSYSKLFTQLKHNTEEGHPDIGVAYFMVSADSGQVCPISRAWMRKKEHYEEFTIPASQALPLPLDNQLRKVNPDVFVETPSTLNCDISFQVLVDKPVGKTLTSQQVRDWLPQMDTMMENLGGMFASWFMPKTQGVVIHFSPSATGKITSSEGQDYTIDDHQAIIDASGLGQEVKLTLPEAPIKVSPWLPKNG
ncbi:hypothetical protein BZG78_10575 [Salinivibrio sp. MA351]|uniref:DUF2987 domain-containing protein n=1 Tax=Salinivibrio costicola subsp. alcaliphilus TaxID=272773 RepID=A0ABX3KUB5_SALCS|nr:MULTISPECIES: DUF2987 domain-containing protein [Salinivibrio]OOE92817.1 hypothetical protein BZG76_05910 [Salinivibrio sp. AR647]OOE95483.1 hypothetical protein BZG75_01925 [Salinivibrio sp. AR640]OOE97860.1 hypothetical protein BZG78_10575 [Salinivibrio sp. MA351]OOF01964.1 hypothetical protein BZG80_13880 [Salinivibrio sp. MA440]OOF06230.1 hypothetical protein BZG81_04180 [Salinivibrio sp. MA607]